jgi:hypothetical protein
MKTHLLISSPNGEMKSTYVCPQVNLKIREIDFEADLVILTSSGIDVILGMDWLSKHDGIILCAKKSVLLTTPQGDRIEFAATSPKKKEKLISSAVVTHHLSRSSCISSSCSPIPPNLGTRFSLRG